MEGFIIGFFIGYFARWMIAVVFDEYQTNKELLETKIEVENAYNYGYMKGQLETELKYRKKLDDLCDRYMKPKKEVRESEVAE